MRGAEHMGIDLSWTTDTPNPVLVLGLGNILIQDEGIGVRVVERLVECYDIPAEVDVLDGGTAGLALYDDIVGRKHLIVVDAIENRCEPGTLITLRGEDVPSFFRNKVSPHQMALSDILAALEIMGEKPAQVVVIGIQPKDLGTGLEMSELISSQVDILVQRVIDQLGELGYPPTRLAH